MKKILLLKFLISYSKIRFAEWKIYFIFEIIWLLIPLMITFLKTNCDLWLKNKHLLKSWNN